MVAVVTAHLKAELMMAKTIGAVGDDIMFSSNDTPLDEFRYCNKLGGIINLDDITYRGS